MRRTVSPALIAVGFLAVIGVLWRFVRGTEVAALIPSLLGWGIVGAAAGLHELGHAACALACGVRISGLRLDLFGARMSLSGLIAYRHEAVIALGGPLANLITAALVLPAAWVELTNGTEAPVGCVSWAVALFVVASLLLAAVNLLPVSTLDGGRFLTAILEATFGPRSADAVLTVTTALCLGTLWLFSVYALLRVGSMLSLFGFSLCLLYRLLPSRDGLRA